MTSAEFRKAVAAEFKAVGWERYSSGWWLPGSEVKWAGHLGKSPHAPRFDLAVGCWLDSPAEVPAESAEVAQVNTSAPLLTGASSQVADDGLDHEFYALAMNAFDLKIELDDQERRTAVQQTVEMVDSFARSHQTFDALLRSYKSGPVKRAMVLADTYRRFTAAN